MRRHMEGEMKEMEDKMKTIVKLMVLKERQTWASERQQLLNEEEDATEEAEKHDSSRILFRGELQKQRQRAGEEIKKRDEVIKSVQQRVHTLEEDIERRAATANESSWWDEVSDLFRSS
ncbi:golgin subfamily A member 6-like protein 22 [Scomber scombrus]|uniref:Golgin subfamily A member 6-like protein 22 n=1 Tax=Scomber scombrus TaxID=13677 RepID=A0AAV1PK30_SCOSC